MTTRIGHSSDATQAGPDERIDQRITEIESWMGAKKGSRDYKKYWGNDKVQAEYRELLRERQDRYPWLVPGQSG